MVTQLKLTNLLYRFNEFYNEVQIHVDLNNELRDQLKSLHEEYLEVTDLSIDNTFEPSENIEFSLGILEFVLDEFRYFKNIFDYTVEQILDICPGLVIEHYKEIYDYLVDTYSLNEEGDISMMNANIQEIDTEEEEESFETYDFEPNNIFVLKPEFKDGDEGEYFVIEDRGDKVLASPYWETGLSILPQEVIYKHMIAEVMPYNRVELPTEQVNEKLVKKKLKDFPFIKTYINLLGKSDKVKSEEKLIQEYKAGNSNEIYTDYNAEFDLSAGDIVTIRAGYNSDIAYTTKIWGFDSEGLAYVIWDCYWVPLRLSERLLFANKEL